MRGLEDLSSIRGPLIFLKVHPARVLARGDSLALFADFFEKHGYECRSMRGEQFEWRQIFHGSPDVRIFLSA